MKHRVLLVALGVIGVTILLGGVWGVRWALAWNDLPAFARPKGFHQIAHDYECGNGHDAYCAHSWLYVSADRTFRDAVRDLEARYDAAGWVFFACNFTPDTCSSAQKGKYEDCISYSDFKADYKRDYGVQVDWRHKFQKQIESSASTIEITRGCV